MVKKYVVGGSRMTYSQMMDDAQKYYEWKCPKCGHTRNNKETHKHIQ